MNGILDFYNVTILFPTGLQTVQKLKIKFKSPI